VTPESQAATVNATQALLSAVRNAFHTPALPVNAASHLLNAMSTVMIRESAGDTVRESSAATPVIQSLSQSVASSMRLGDPPVVLSSPAVVVGAFSFSCHSPLNSNALCC
jgi:hypothetical protein